MRTLICLSWPYRCLRNRLTWTCLAAAIFFPATSAHADALDNWTTTQVGTNSFALNYVVYGNGRYVAAGGWGDKGAILSSEDGLNWALRAKGSNGCCPSLAWGLAFGGGRYVTVGHFGGTASSTDGTNWV